MKFLLGFICGALTTNIVLLIILALLEVNNRGN